MIVAGAPVMGVIQCTGARRDRLRRQRPVAPLRGGSLSRKMRPTISDMPDPGAQRERRQGRSLWFRRSHCDAQTHESARARFAPGAVSRSPRPLKGSAGSRRARPISICVMADQCNGITARANAILRAAGGAVWSISPAHPAAYARHVARA